MTATQKQRITELRERGESYAKISTLLAVSENTVKSFCRRNNLGGSTHVSISTKATKQAYCKQCGNDLVQIPGHRAKKFCSYSCRMKWWNTNPGHINRKAVYTFVCHYCRTEFTAYGNKGRKYCSHACYINTRFGSEKVGGQI